MTSRENIRAAAALRDIRGRIDRASARMEDAIDHVEIVVRAMRESHGHLASARASLDAIEKEAGDVRQS